MKVCTDATLFGAMAQVKGGDQVLDIGTGTGLLALMTAQLGASRVTGVELSEEAFEEARVNFNNSPWSERLNLAHGSIQGFSGKTRNRYDLIICNPPFFNNHSKAADHLRRQARHDDLLPLADLIECVDRLLGDRGMFYLLLPIHAARRFSGLAHERGLHQIARTDIRGHSHNQAKVSALTFSRQMQSCSLRLLTIYQSDRDYSKQSEHYLSPFLLRFA